MTIINTVFSYEWFHHSKEERVVKPTCTTTNKQLAIYTNAYLAYIQWVTDIVHFKGQKQKQYINIYDDKGESNE